MENLKKLYLVKDLKGKYRICTAVDQDEDVATTILGQQIDIKHKIEQMSNYDLLGKKGEVTYIYDTFADSIHSIDGDYLYDENIKALVKELLS